VKIFLFHCLKSVFRDDLRKITIPHDLEAQWTSKTFLKSRLQVQVLSRPLANHKVSEGSEVLFGFRGPVIEPHSFCFFGLERHSTMLVGFKSLS